MGTPGKSHREGIGLVQLMDLFPDERAAREWFEAARWGDRRTCPRCGSERTVETSATAPMPYRCKDCRQHFSVKTGTVMQASNLPLRTWVFGIYLLSTSLKGVLSMKLHRDLRVTQKTAWMMAQKIREGWIAGSTGPMGGSVEVDETYSGAASATSTPRAAWTAARLEGAYGMTEQPTRGRGRPAKPEPKPLPASAEEIRDAIFRAADRLRTDDGAKTA